MKSWALAARAAASISSLVASSFPYAMFSQIVVPSSIESCSTTAIWSRSEAWV